MLETTGPRQPRVGDIIWTTYNWYIMVRHVGGVRDGRAVIAFDLDKFSTKPPVYHKHVAGITFAGMVPL